MKALACLLLAFVACGACAQGLDPLSSDLGQPGANVLPKVDISKVHITQRLGAFAPPDATFRSADGKAVQFGSLLGKRPLILLPIFYRCQGVCNVELQGLLATLPSLKQRIGKDFDMVVLSIDPQEGPEIAAGKFAATIGSAPALKGTESGWHFLTGDLRNIRLVTDAVGFYYTYDAATDVINHPSGIIFLTPRGVVSSYILGANYAPDRLSTAINTANASKIGTKAQEVFFGCVHVDPITGRRSIVIERFLSLLALVTVFAIVGTIATLSIRSRRLSRQ